jgi:hypothetical protein
MNTLGIEKEYKIIKKVRRKLLLNDKFVNYLLKQLNKGNYVYMTSSHSYETVSPELIKELINKAEDNDRYWNLDCFAQVADYPEYEGVPFEVTHASPYDHRWPGDYDEDAYDDWKVDAISLSDLLYEDTWQREPVYVKHPEMFDFADEEVVVEDEKLEDTNCWW